MTTARFTRVLVAAGAAAMGLLASRAAGSAKSPAMVVFSRNGQNTPYFSKWNGSTWSSATAMPTVASNPYWVEVRNCPTRLETACMTLGQDETVRVQFYNG